MNKTGPCSVGLIGCGYWGPNLLRNLYHLKAQVPLVADALEQRRQWVSDRYPATQVTASWKAVVEDEQLDAVVVATPPQTHYEIARAALLAGKHVLVEKPMTLKASRAEELVELADDRGLVLMVDHIYIYTDAIREMKRLIQSGEIGEVYYYDSVRVNLGIFQSNTNVLWDLGPHDLAILDYLLNGLSIESLSAMGSDLRGIPQEYQVHAGMKLKHDITAHLHLNWLSPVKIRSIVIAGQKKMMVFDENNPAEQLKIYDKGFEPSSDEERYKALGTYRSGDMRAPRLEGREALHRMVEQFLACVTGGGNPDADGAHGARVVKALEQVQSLLDEEKRRGL